MNIKNGEKYGGRCVYCGASDTAEKNNIGCVCVNCLPIKHHTIDTYRQYLEQIKPMLKGIGLSIIGDVNFFYESYTECTAFDSIIQKHNVKDASHHHVTLDQSFIVNPNNPDDWYWFNTMKSVWQPTYSMRGSLSIYSLKGKTNV